MTGEDQKAQRAAGGPRGPRVLVIEDQPTVLDLVCEALDLMGYEPTGVATGMEGLGLFEQGTYDLVVTDLVMPGMTGWEVAAAARQRAPAMGIILMTATAMPLDPNRARRLNVTLLEKPFRLEALQEAVDYVMALPGERGV